MIELPSLHPHQEALAGNVSEAFKRHRNIVLCASTGAGKTRCSKWMLGKAVSRPRSPSRSGNVLFTVHRRGLVENASSSFGEEPSLPHGMIMSQRDTDGGKAVQVASIDTLLSWYCEEGTYRTAHTYDFITYDECQSHLDKFKKFITVHNKKREDLGLCQPFVLGLSATPQAKGLSDIFGEIVSGPSAQWLVDNGYLSPFRYFQATSGDMGKLVKLGDDFTKGSVASAMDGLAGDLVRDWKLHAEGRATVGFFPRKTHAKEAMELLCAAGVRCEYVDGGTADAKRNKMFAALNNGDIDYICNVGVIERGTDIPRIGCVQLCTCIGSIVRFKQMVGRGARVHPDVPDCIVLDHGENVRRHGFFEDEVDWTLDWSTRPTKDHEAKPTVACPKCKSIYRGGKCAKCGYEPTKREFTAMGLKFDKSELVEITALKKKREPGSKKSNEQLLIAALYRSGRSGRTFDQAIGMARKEARNQGTEFIVPKHFEVAGKKFEALNYGSLASKDRVAATYPFTTGNHRPEANPYFVAHTNQSPT